MVKVKVVSDDGLVKRSKKNSESVTVTDNVTVRKSLQKAKKKKALKSEKTVKQNKPFPEKTLNIVDIQEKYCIKSNDIKKAVKGVIKFHSENPKLQNQLFQERLPLFLQVSSHHVPRGHSRIIRIPLPNPVLTPDDEVCLIVPEVKGIKNIEHEKHVEHYQELLRKNGINNIKKIMTCHEFRTEHETFEQKSRLADLYDVFLVDGRISGRVVNKCGKIFYKKRKVPTAVKLQVSKLKEHIDKALSKVYLHMHLKGDSYMVQFGHNKMDIGDLVENVLSVIDGLNKEFPGGMENIKGIHVYMARATPIPVYMSLKNPTEVSVPKIALKRPKAYKTYKDELSTRLNSEVTVRPRGDIIVKKIGKENGNDKEEKVKKMKKINEEKLVKTKKDKALRQVVETEKDEEAENGYNVEKIKKDKKIKKTNDEGVVKKRDKEEKVKKDNEKKDKTKKKKASRQEVEVEKSEEVDNGHNVGKIKKNKSIKETNDEGVKKAHKKHKQNEETFEAVVKKKKKRHISEGSDGLIDGNQEEIDEGVKTTSKKVKKTINRCVEKKLKTINIGDKVKKNKLKKKIKQSF